MSYQEERAAAFRVLLARLARDNGVSTLTAAEIAAKAAATPALAVLFTADPTVSPESWDASVVLPELIASCPGLEGGVLDPDESARAARTFGVGRLPALVLLRNGAYTGAIEGMRDWPYFRDELRRLTTAPPRSVPAAAIHTASRSP